MKKSAIRAETALVRRRPVDYEDRFFWSMLTAFGRLETETGLPWIRGFQMALFRVTVSFVKKERNREINDLHSMLTYLNWVWTMLAFGASVKDEVDPVRVSEDIVEAANSRLQARLLSMSSSEDIERLLAEEIVGSWRSYIETMRATRDRINQEVDGFIQSIASHTVYTFLNATHKPGQVLIQIPYERSDSLARTFGQFFLPERRSDILINQIYLEQREFRQRVAYTQVLLELPFCLARLPAEDPVGLAAKADINLDDNWLRTQILLAVLELDLWQETVPWKVEGLLKQLPDCAPSLLVKKFWQRMDARGMKPLSAQRRALLEPRVIDRAKSVLQHRALALRGKTFHDSERVAVYVIEPPIRKLPGRSVAPTASTKSATTSLNATVVQWMERYYKETPTSESAKRGIMALKALTIREKQTFLLTLYTALAGESREKSYTKVYATKGIFLGQAVSVVLDAFFAYEDAWGSEVITSLENLVDVWAYFVVAEGSSSKRTIHYVNSACTFSERLYLHCIELYGEAREREILRKKDYALQALSVIRSIVVGITHHLNKVGDRAAGWKIVSLIIGRSEGLAKLCVFASADPNDLGHQSWLKRTMSAFDEEQAWLIGERDAASVDAGYFTKQVESAVDELAIDHSKRKKKRTP